MKHLKNIFIVMLFMTSTIDAQSQTISESTESIGGLTGNALSVTIIRADQKEIEREWKSLMKSYDGKVKIKGDNIFTTDAQIESISSGNVQVNAETEKESGNKHTFTVIFMSERGAVSSKDDVSGYTAANIILREFAKKLSLKAATAHKDAERKKLDELKKEKESLEEENRRLAKRIEEYKQKITDAQQSIKNNEKLLLIKNEEITEQEKEFSKSVEELKSIR